MHQVCAPSCHDCSTLRAWWEEDQERRLRFFKTFVGTDSVPPDECTPDVARFILRQHVEAPSMWSIFPLQVCHQSIIYFYVCISKYYISKQMVHLQSVLTHYLVICEYWIRSVHVLKSMFSYKASLNRLLFDSN